jgi:hypothetical protein
MFAVVSETKLTLWKWLSVRIVNTKKKKQINGVNSGINFVLMMIIIASAEKGEIHNG